MLVSLTPLGAFNSAHKINVIHYVKKQKALDELLRTLKSGGYFFIQFNLDIVDIDGNIDYHHDERDIRKLVSKYTKSAKYSNNY